MDEIEKDIEAVMESMRRPGEGARTVNLRDYVRAGYLSALRSAADVCRSRATCEGIAQECAAAIEALIPPPSPPPHGE